MNITYSELEYGATADLMPGTPFTLLNRIAVQKRGHGAGSRLMHHIIDDADAEGADLMLCVDPSPGMDENRLRVWYYRLGFRQFQLDDPDTLVRYHRTEVQRALEMREEAAAFAHGGTCLKKPIVTTGLLLAAGGKLAEVKDTERTQ